MRWDTSGDGSSVASSESFSGSELSSRPEPASQEGAGRDFADPVRGATATEFAAMLDGMSSGVVAVDRQWRLSFVNAWMERVLGRSREKLLGRDLWAEFPSLATSSFGAAYRRAMREGIEVIHEDFVPQSNAWFEGRACPSSTGLLIFIRDVTERRRVARELKEREDRLRFVLEAGGLGYWRHERATGRVELSEGARANFGLAPDANLSSFEALSALVHPDDRPAMTEAVERALTTSSDYSAEYRVLLPGGGVRQLVARGRKVYAPDGTLQGLAGISLDVTERTAVEQALRESEARFRNMADNAPVMLWMTDVSGACIWLNRQWHDFTGQTEAEGRGLGWLDAVHPDDRGRAGDAFLSSHGSQAPFRVEYRIRSRDGEYRWAIDSASPRLGASGEFLGYIGSVIDIHDLKRGEERLAFVSEASRILSESLDYEATLARATQLAVPTLGDWCMLDMLQEGGGIKRVKVSCSSISGLETLVTDTVRFPPLLEGHPWHSPSQALREGRAILVEDAGDAYKEKAAFGPEHLAHMKAIGFQSVMAVPLVARGRTLGVITFLAIGPGRRFTQADLETAEDLARRAALAVDNGRLYREAQRAVRVREEFLQVASHELKTPLTPLSLKLQMLARMVGAFPQERFPRLASDVEMMRQQVQRLSSLMDELLDISRITSGRFSLTLEFMDLAVLVRDTAARFEPEVLRQGGRLDVETPDAVEGIWDRQRLEQVLTNLLSNALKYGGGKPVHVRLSRDGERARLVVRDEGIGIAPESLPRIFEKFERAVSDKHYGGLGLGLYITRQIVQALGGTIHAQSEPARGSTFVVELPLIPPTAS
ncbi:sensor histidine kinase [Pyxidicoccus xibeiensis]|uniref:sensor histidine kinase n=1 Tax=Pyxidicoccus xibeiensis TaxID=2906759 RepID=UPI0020A6E04A|nr:PAS domain S-box protein [Pyxidicoccus xibeiensis]MCP3140592.1 PAS domain S-box protein [Pyxidicoccus xibeiensis]